MKARRLKSCRWHLQFGALADLQLLPQIPPVLDYYLHCCLALNFRAKEAVYRKMEKECVKLEGTSKEEEANSGPTTSCPCFNLIDLRPGKPLILDQLVHISSIAHRLEKLIRPCSQNGTRILSQSGPSASDGDEAQKSFTPHKVCQEFPDSSTIAPVVALMFLFPLEEPPSAGSSCGSSLQF